jgi:hypothetical protein
MLQGLAQFRIALLDSLNNRTFSMAMTAWSAKVLTNAICLSLNGLTSLRQVVMTPTSLSSRSIGTDKTVRTFSFL